MIAHRPDAFRRVLDQIRGTLSGAIAGGRGGGDDTGNAAHDGVGRDRGGRLLGFETLVPLDRMQDVTVGANLHKWLRNLDVGFYKALGM